MHIFGRPFVCMHATWHCEPSIFRFSFYVYFLYVYMYILIICIMFVNHLFDLLTHLDYVIIQVPRRAVGHTERQQKEIKTLDSI